MAVTRKPLILLIMLLLGGCMTVAEKEAIEALPMYGQPELARSDYLQRQDAAFIQQASYRYRGDLKRAGRAWSGQGFEILRLGDPDEAMRRFNRAWLLDRENYQVYWGFAQVLVIRGELADAAHYLEQALELLDDPYQKPALLTDMGTVYSLQGEQAESARAGQGVPLFEQANAQFAEAVALDGSYLPVWQRWVRSRYREGDYRGAWEKVWQARERGVALSRPFLQELSERMPEPPAPDTAAIR